MSGVAYQTHPACERPTVVHATYSLRCNECAACQGWTTTCPCGQPIGGIVYETPDLAPEQFTAAILSATQLVPLAAKCSAGHLLEVREVERIRGGFRVRL